MKVETRNGWRSGGVGFGGSLGSDSHGLLLWSRWAAGGGGDSIGLVSIGLSLS